MPNLPKALQFPPSPSPEPTPVQVSVPPPNGPHHYTQAAAADRIILSAWLHETNEAPTYLLRLDYQLPADDPEMIELLQLQVQPEHQQQGHGRRAILALLQQAIIEGRTRCLASTIDENSPAWTVPITEGAKQVAQGSLAFALDEADPFFRWLQTDAQGTSEAS